MKVNPLTLLACPKCHLSLTRAKNTFYCRKCHGLMKLKNGIVLNVSYLPEDLRLSLKKWDELYKAELETKEYEQRNDEYKNIYQEDTEAQLREARSLDGVRYLEIGCGEFFFGQAVADTCELIIGIDLSELALTIAKKMLDKKNIRNYLLIQGDIRYMPLKNNSVDVIYGGGVIEHFKDTNSCLSELYRVLKRGGVSFNTVPYLNIASLTYRQLWGNIPNVPVLKQIAEFIHIKLLGARHMIFGYEMSFTKRSIVGLHQSAGFRKVIVDKFQVQFIFKPIPKMFRPFFSYIADTFQWFWPMVKVIGYK